ncbi:trypsin-like peptidase domain-containing protein [Streptomyces sp. NPDC050703]|uniref:trypsin-like peptidase domain-containing protein n=1 Tax=Streptomyces sp. NPDC050703 TaxID=3157218 RepID=UPI00343688B8
MRARGLEPGWAAEIIVTPHGGGTRRGSGYLVRDGLVLTAEHVVHGAARVEVRFDADRPRERTHRAETVWSRAGIDAALLSVPQEKPDGAIPVGRVGERDAVLRCSTLGFPRFKLRADRGSNTAYRDIRHAEGSAPVLSNRREGTLELHVQPPERDPDPHRSPWEGMSGAPVLSGGRLIGIVGRHHRSDGLGTLAVLRMDRWHERLPPAELDTVQALLGLRIGPGDLPEVLPADPGELVHGAQLRQVRDIAPPELVGREQETAELIAFCAGGESYQWWQAPPWSGKTALASTFVLNPPAGVRPVSFFVTARWAEQADSDAFTDAMIAQLAPLAGVEATPTGRDGLRRLLLDRAAERLAEQDETLLLVVDGLDEDRAAGPGSARPSIAALLPPRPPANVRVLVTSRPHPGVPLDVPDDHPLRRCARRHLSTNDYARHTRDEAKRELHEALRGDQAQLDLLGLLTAAQGGLTAKDLVELTGLLPFQMESRLASVLGRSLRTGTRWDLTEEQGYLFAHETLHEQAAQALGTAVEGYRDRIHAWADGFRAQGWPEGTPGYLLHTYGRLLAGAGDLDRYLSTITDRRRQARLLAVTGSDAVAQAEVAAARRRLAGAPEGDLGTVVELALVADELTHRNAGLPVGLPAVWGALGLTSQAEGIARTLLDEWDTARALARVVVGAAVPAPRLTKRVIAETTAWVSAGFAAPAHAAEPAHSVEAYHHARFCADRAVALVRAGDARAALAEALRAPHPWERAFVLRDVAERTLAGVAGGTVEPTAAEALAAAAEALAADRCGQPARTLLLACAGLLVRGDDTARAAELMGLAERIPPRRSALTLACLAVLTRTVCPESAARLAVRAKLRAERRRIRTRRAPPVLGPFGTVGRASEGGPRGALAPEMREALSHARPVEDEVGHGVFELCAAAERGEELRLPPSRTAEGEAVRVCVAERLVALGKPDEARRVTTRVSARGQAEVAAAIALSRAADAPSEAAESARDIARAVRESLEGSYSALAPVLGVLSDALADLGDTEQAGHLSRQAPEPTDTWARAALSRARSGTEAKRVFRQIRARPAWVPGAVPHAHDVEVVARLRGFDHAIADARDTLHLLPYAPASLATLIRLLPEDDARRAECAAMARALAYEGMKQLDPAHPQASDAWWSALAATLWGQPDAVRGWITGRARDLAGRRTSSGPLFSVAPRLRWLLDPFERASAVLALSRVDSGEAASLFVEWSRSDSRGGQPLGRGPAALWAMTALLMGLPPAGGSPAAQSLGAYLGTAALAAAGGGRSCWSPPAERLDDATDLRRLLLLDAYAGPARMRDSAAAEHMVRALLVRDDWWRAVPALALLDPDAVRRVGGVVTRRLNRVLRTS